MAKDNAAGYEIDSRQLTQAIAKCQGVIALGDKAESNSISLVFTKKGLAVEATNSVASYRCETAVTVHAPVSKRVSLLPELLLSYAANFPKLVLSPKDDALGVKGGKGFAASVYYVGEVEPVSVATTDDANDISAVATAVNEHLSVVGGFKNRTDKQELGVILGWGSNELTLVLGDTHHVVVVKDKIKQKASGELTMALQNLRKIMDIGANFASVDGELRAWNDSEYLSLANQTENVFLADTAQEALGAKKRTVVDLSTATFRDMVNVITAAVEENNSVMFELSASEIKASINTNAGRAVKRDKPVAFKGKDQKITVSIHHLRDCLSVVKTKEVRLVVYDNMLSLECGTETTSYYAVMAAMAAL